MIKEYSGGISEKRIPRKFFKRLRVGASKEVATVNATKDGRKVKTGLNPSLK